MMEKIYATISADVVSSTSLTKEDMTELSTKIKSFLNQLTIQYHGFWGRLVKGDTIECITSNPNDALKLAILLKTFIKSYTPKTNMTDAKFKHIGLRLVIGIGKMRTVNKDLDIMDGEAIYLSGRTLDNMKNKDSFQIITYDQELFKQLPIIISLINHIINKATSRQCETLFYKLQYKTNIEVSETINTTTQYVGQNLRNIGWDAIKQSILYFEQIKFQTL